MAHKNTLMYSYDLELLLVYTVVQIVIYFWKNISSKLRVGCVKKKFFLFNYKSCAVFMTIPKASITRTLDQ